MEFRRVLNYIKYDIYWHLVFDVTMLTFQMTFLMDKRADSVF